MELVYPAGCPWLGLALLSTGEVFRAWGTDQQTMADACASSWQLLQDESMYHSKTE